MLGRPLDQIALAVSLVLALASTAAGQVLPNPYRQDFKAGGLGPAGVTDAVSEQRTPEGTRGHQVIPAG